MSDGNAFEGYYRNLTDEELLNRGGEDGFTEEAAQALHQELVRRHLKLEDVKRYAAALKRNKFRDEVVERGGGYRSLGLQFFGKSYLNESDRSASIQIRTKWFTMSGIPLIPIASYRFKCANHPGKFSRIEAQQRVINRVPLNWAQVFVTWMRTLLLFTGAGLLIVGVAWYLDRTRR